MNREHLHITLERDLKREAKAEASLLGISLSTFISFLIRKYLGRKEGENENVREEI